VGDTADVGKMGAPAHGLPPGRRRPAGEFGHAGTPLDAKGRIDIVAVGQPRHAAQVIADGGTAGAFQQRMQAAGRVQALPQPLIGAPGQTRQCAAAGIVERQSVDHDAGSTIGSRAGRRRHRARIARQFQRELLHRGGQAGRISGYIVGVRRERAALGADACERRLKTRFDHAVNACDAHRRAFGDHACPLAGDLHFAFALLFAGQDGDPRIALGLQHARNRPVGCGADRAGPGESDGPRHGGSGAGSRPRAVCCDAHGGVAPSRGSRRRDKGMVSVKRRRGLTPVKGDPWVNLWLTRAFDSCEHRGRRSGGGRGEWRESVW
jgi:hypothetical protein